MKCGSAIVRLGGAGGTPGKGIDRRARQHRNEQQDASHATHVEQNCAFRSPEKVGRGNLTVPALR
jgi:hypothetical protein